MRTPESFPPLLPEAPDERVEQWLGGDLSAEEARRVEAAVARYPAWARAADASRCLPGVLRRAPAPVAPPGFAASVMAEVGARERARPRPSRAGRLSGWLRVPAWQPALALATAALVAVAAWPRPPQPTPEEVAASVEDVKWTLAYLSRTTEQTSLRVRDQVLAPRVVAPVHRAIESTLEPTL